LQFPREENPILACGKLLPKNKNFSRQNDQQINVHIEEMSMFISHKLAICQNESFDQAMTISEEKNINDHLSDFFQRNTRPKPCGSNHQD